jgi:hypothetical protein
MSRKPLFNHGMLIVALLLSWSAGAYAQITITSSDVLGLIGKSQTTEDDTSGNDITVNVGTAGTNRTWDFRSLTLQTDKITNQFLAPQGTPFAARVPQANFVLKIFSASEPGDIVYGYFQVSSTALRLLGNGVTGSFGSFFSVANAQNVSPLPLQLNTTWTSVESDTLIDPQSGASSITVSTSNNTVDGSGQVRLPIGDFDCLRIRNNNTTISKVVFGGMVVFSDTSKSIDYNWISRTDFIVASVSSQDGETNPNYTTAASFSRLFSRTTAVEAPRASENIPADFALSQNFPNPFNPATEIAFQIARAGHAELSIYNIAGEKVRTLISGTVPAGSHSVKWDGKDENSRRLASGTYIYRLKAGNFSEAKKMLLLQ